MFNKFSSLYQKAKKEKFKRMDWIESKDHQGINCVGSICQTGKTFKMQVKILVSSF